LGVAGWQKRERTSIKFPGEVIKVGNGRRTLDDRQCGKRGTCTLWDPLHRGGKKVKNTKLGVGGRERMKECTFLWALWGGQPATKTVKATATRTGGLQEKRT